MIKIYHNPRCSKSRQALEILQERGLNPEVILYLEAALSQDQLSQLLAKSNLTIREAMRTSESIYSELQLETATDSELVAAIAKHPNLLNRPLVETDKGVRLGRPFEAVEDIL